MSKTAQRRNADKKKLPFALQRLLNGARKDDGAPLLGETFGLSYEHNRRMRIVQSKEFQDAMNAVHADNPFKEVPYGRGKFSYVSVALAARIDVIHAQFGLDAVSEENRGKGWSYADIEIGEEYEPNKRCLEQIGNATEFLRQVEEYERQYKTPEQHARLHLLKVKVRVDQRAQQFRKDWEEKGRVIDHAAIKARFDNTHGDGLAERTAFGDALTKVHQENPFFRFIFGRAEWSYISLEAAAKIDAVLIAEGRKMSGGEPWTSSKATYISYPGEVLRYFPPMALDRHQTLLDWLEEEWPFATDEQRELGRRLIAKVEEDGFKVHASLKELINKE